MIKLAIPAAALLAVIMTAGTSHAAAPPTPDPHEPSVSAPGSLKAPPKAATPPGVAHAAHTSYGGQGNTVDQINKVGAAGGWAVEIDVRFSKTGYAVITHDADVSTTTNGTGHVWNMTVAQLTKLKPPIPTVGAAVNAARNHGMKVFLDVKTDTITATQATNLNASVTGTTWKSQVTVIADAYYATRRAGLKAARAKGLHTGWVEPYRGRRSAATIASYTGDTRRNYFTAAKETPAADLDYYQANGVWVVAGTPNSADGWNHVLDHGVDAILTDELPVYLAWAAQ